MSVFLFVLFPLFFLCVICSSLRYFEQVSKQSVMALVACGAIASAIFCAVEELFVLPLHYHVYNLFREYIDIFAVEYLLPLFLCLVLYLLFTRDSVAFKMRSFVWILFGFYAVFMPYKIFTRYEILSPFVLFVKPVIVLCYTIALLRTFCVLAHGIMQKSAFAIVTSILFTLVALVLPALIEVLWYLSAEPFIWISLCIAYVAYCTVFLFFYQKIALKE